MRFLIGGIAAAIFGTAAIATEYYSTVTYGTFGTPGLIDMPTAESAPDGELAVTNSYFAGINRTSLTFQLLPRLSGTFRYTVLPNATGPSTPTSYDRSFDFRFRIIDEGRFRPAVAVGLQDFIGTGIYAAEYIVATKHIGQRLKVSGGLGWGRLASVGGFSNPLGVFGSGFLTRPAAAVGLGGTADPSVWFRGNAAFFGGVEWQATDRLSLKFEFSSDAYTRESVFGGTFARNSPFNFGVTYRVARGVNVSAYYLYGSTIGASVNFTFNPRLPKVFGGAGPAPIPVANRVPGARFDTAWTEQIDGERILRDNLQNFFDQEGIQLESMSLSTTSVYVRIRNQRFDSSAQAVGRVARILTNVMPASVESFTIVPLVQGVPVAGVTLQRSDIEQLENAADGAWQSFVRAEITDAPRRPEGLMYHEGAYPRFQWSIGPYATASAFDPNDPLRADFGVQFKAQYEVRPGLVFSTLVRKRLIGNLAQSTRVSNSVIQRVRSDSNIYDRQGDPSIVELIVAQYFRPGPNLYGRITVGYFERMYGGVSAEILWKPVESPIAFSIEINYAQQRNFDQLFGFQAYGVATGHVSAYWDMGNGFHAQLDLGRYLAGDWGGTITIDREFKNGWRVGAFATFTTVSFADFGEGSFDKGLRFTIPLSGSIGRPTRTRVQTVFRPITRDGGARVIVPNRLYEGVREYHSPALRDQWGRFWQ